MKKRGRIITLMILSVIAFAAVTLSMVFAFPQRVEAECVFDQFKEGEYVTKTAYTDVDGNKAFAIFAGEDGVSVDLRKQFQGVFETSFVALKASDGGLGSSLFDIIFRSDKDLTFSLSIRRNGADSFAYVSANDKKMGIHPEMVGFTSMVDRAETYTNVRSANKYDVVFDPSLMTILVNGKLIWDFSKTTNDGYNVGFTLDKFAKYDVSLVFERSSGESALAFYKLCGEDLGGQVIRDTGAPTFFVDKKADAFLGMDYTIPEATVFDFVDGEINDYYVNCFAPDGRKIFDGSITGKETFKVDRIGEYSIVYAAMDTKGHTASYTVCVSAVENDDCKVELSDTLVSSAPLNSSVSVPSGFITSKLLCHDTDNLAVRKIYFGTEEIMNLSDKDNENVTLDISKKGTYFVKYSYEKFGLSCEKTFEITVTDSGYEDFVLQKEYASDTSFVIPTVNYYDGANKVTATPTLTYPSGKTSTSDCVLDEVGEYALKYSCKGKPDSVAKKFMVSFAASSLFDVAYGTVTDAHSYIHDDLVGVQVALTAAGSLKYNNVIDFTGKTKDDYFIELIVTPSEYLNVDFSQLFIRLTDTENPDNWVEIKAFDMASNRADGTYVRARRNDTPLVATGGGPDTFKPDDARYGGYPVLHSFRGSANGVDLRTQTLKFAFDPNDKSIYSDSNGMDYPVYEYTRLVANLCDPTWCGEWDGFTNNTAYLSIYCSSIATIANFMILNIDGNDLGSYTIDPAVKPVITVTGVDETIMPYAVAGEAFPVPDAYATDAFNRILDLNVEVYENYGLASQKKVAVTNGSFTPEKAGSYSIRYYARDYYGNVTEKVLPVTAYASGAYDGALKFNYSSTEPTDYKEKVVGKYIALTRVEWSGGAGYLHSSVKVTGPDGGARESFDYKGSSVFFADKVGTYNVAYSVKDYLGKTQGFSLSISVGSGSGPALLEDITLPDVFIEGFSYRLPTPKAYFHSTGGYLDPVIEITDGNGVYNLEGDVYKPVRASNTDEIKIKYSYAGTTVEKTVACKSVKNTDGGIDITRYFTAENGTLISSMKSIEFNTSSENNSLTLDIPVSVVGLDFSLDVGKLVETDKENVAFDGLDITLSDYYDPYYKVLLSYRRSDDKISYSVNKGTPVLTVGSFTTASADNLQFSYSSSTYEIYNRKATNIGIVKNYLTGEPFDGFKSGFVSIKISLIGVKGSSSIEMFSLNGQPLTSTQLDRIKPIVYTKDDFGGRSVIGDVIGTGTASAYDMLSGVAKVLVSVTSPSGKVVKSTDGKEIKNLSADISYNFKCTETGAYEITFVATDSSKNKGLATKRINVVDETPPVVIINGEIRSEVSVGTTMSIPSVTERNGKKCTVNVMVYDPDYAVFKTVFDGKYTFDKKGTFIVRYFVFDDFYNCVIIDYTVKVS